MTTRAWASQYSGDSAWRKYASNYREQWAYAADKAQLLTLSKGDEEIAMALNARLGGNGAIYWLQHVHPYLNGRAPIALLDEGEIGRKAIRAMIMQLH